MSKYDGWIAGIIAATIGTVAGVEIISYTNVKKKTTCWCLFSQIGE